MERLLFQARYERDYILDGETFIWKSCRYSGGWPRESIEDFMIDAKEFAEFVQMDADIIETEQEIAVRYYPPYGFVFFDLAKEQLGRLISCGDGLRFQMGKNDLYDCVIEILYKKPRK